ncbi:indole-3-glycerol-phosphate synthase [Candidatus Peregrinibacteria bacterium]|nr:indole-3-glycerol-phosphate synthase [Candidatus Peregrinibacteria bacterium]
MNARSSFIDAVLARRPSLIAEVKPRSPSAGELLRREEIPALVDTYNRHAQAISVLCDAPRFGGGYDLLADVRSMTDLPLLAKDFMRTDAQIEQANQAGANAILLIVAILEISELSRLASHAIDLHLDVLIEVHTEEELEKVVDAFGTFSEDNKRHMLIGINNRNLVTLEIDLGTTERLVPAIRRRFPHVPAIIAESGIRTRTDIERLQPFVQGFLIGTSILKSDDVASHLRSLFGS